MLIIPGIIASSYPRASTAFESIATSTSSGVNSITFSSIPSTYKHLQIRLQYKTAGGDGLYLRFNSDTGSNYVYHRLIGNGTTASATGSTSQVAMEQAAGSNATYFTTAIIDIHDYTSTTKNKVTRTQYGFDANGSGNTGLYSGLWLSTSAINSITVGAYYSGGSNFDSGTSIALYGIKG